MQCVALQRSARLDDFYRPDAFSLYVHVPFCLRRCRYCAFVSSVWRGLPEEAYLDALLNEMAATPVLLGKDYLRSLYFGGGTPSILSDAALGQIIDSLQKKFGTATEITLEANPEHLSLERAQAWRAMGVSRVSLGVQSFDPKMLRFFGRAHGVDEVFSGIACLRKGGFDEISLDLIYGGHLGDTPDEAVLRWGEELKTVCSLAPEHVSCYALSVEPGTPLFKLEQSGQEVVHSDDCLADMMAITPDGLGIEHYEISSYARDGHYSAHNLACWAGEPYLAFGPGAHGFHPQTGEFKRYGNIPDVDKYLSLLTKIDPAALALVDLTAIRDFVEVLSPEQHLAERLICAARTRFWWDPKVIADSIGAKGPNVIAAAEKACAQGLLEQEGTRFRTTEQGIVLNNRLDRLLFDAC